MKNNGSLEDFLMINRPICEEFQQRDKMSDKNPVRSAVSRMFLVTIFICNTLAL